MIDLLVSVALLVREHICEIVFDALEEPQDGCVLCALVDWDNYGAWI